MSDETPELDRETAERLISDAAGDPELAPVAELLTAATAPAYPDELTGMDAALTAFRQSRQDGPPGPRACGRRLIGRALGVKAAAATLTVATVGGVAFAAGTGTLPTALTGTTSPSPPSASAPTGHGAGRLAPPDARSAPPRQTLIGLCRAYDASRRTSPPQALSDAAGGDDKVPAYCVTMLRARPGKQARVPDGRAPKSQTEDGQAPDGQTEDGSDPNRQDPAKAKSSRRRS